MSYHMVELITTETPIATYGSHCSFFMPPHGRAKEGRIDARGVLLRRLMWYVGGCIMVAELIMLCWGFESP